MVANLSARLGLNNGVAIPALGLGLYQSKGGVGKEAERAIRMALDIGYRHFDTAALYRNEEDLGRVLKESKVDREQVFLTTKLWNTDHGYDQALKAFDKSRRALDVDVIDLYLLHWPVEGKRLESWRALESLLAKGLVKAIGVSNYAVRHLEELLNHCEVKPAINQVEFSPFLYQRDLLNYCREADIQLEAYSPLTRAKKLNDRCLLDLAGRYDKSPAQILIRWALQHSIVVLPKSVHKERLEENAAVFDFCLSEEDMGVLDALDESFRTCWDPDKVP